ncbi:high-affinity branched-chain amino acid ABC transporter substrate-binding protein [Agarivorans sp. B2Z047]|uniref:branched-chain amino acid ABC transporter substrate-binding protein n=1 Tax=unclassified Agarivorans TaxID=2636026 RepID=UPI00128CF1F9|nr:branched-chain amino acid ABC transporter substrate-binding protein [Agarivorans sp. B2Z047]MPW30154.1 high-affinity branched-chain amino acid ABC transporter substrate-binding protein [Agarivorans sp. B2Z047]UQN43214.1 branched-chain amino acid ABC transporter substrate-binding protein [Agarivorans sp. B2Z047]
MTKWTKSASGVAVSLALFGAATFAQAADTIKVAIAGPVTGPVAQYGDMQFAGGGIAVELLNQAGALSGKQIEAVVYDDACEPKQAVAVANKIINDGVKYVIGHLCSGATQPASDVYEDEGVLMITPASTNPDITTRDYQLIFRTIGLDSDQGPTAARYIINAVKPERVAVIHDKQQYGEGIATSVKNELEAAGTKVVAFEGVTAGDKDFSALIAKLKKENVDFVYYGGYHPELGLILRQSSEKGLKATFMGPEGVGNKDISAIAGAASEGLLVTLPKKYDLDPANKPVVDALVKNGDDPTGPFVWTAFAAMQSIVAGVNAAGDDPEAVAEFLRGNTVETVMGPLQWDAKGDLKGFDFGVFTWHADGSSSAAK